MKTIKYFIGLGCLGLGMIFLLSRCGSSDSDDSSKKSENKPEMLAEVLPDSIAELVLDTLPYTLEFEEQTYQGNKNLPRLQSYVGEVDQNGNMLIIGGRRQGLHTFKDSLNNFIPDSSNNFIYVIDPESGDFWSFDVNELSSGDLSAALQSTNQQAYYDRPKDQFYVVGGYGWKKDKSNMITFNTIIRFNLTKLVDGIKNNLPADKIEALFEIKKDDRFAVTGGEFFKFNNIFYLIFGQRFDGQYRAFGGSDYTQKYTEEVRIFTFKPNSLDILTYAPQTNADTDHPFHRRDGNFIEDINPATGKPQLSIFGGVFKPGIIGAYTNPIYIDDPDMPTIDKSVNQKFSQYDCPVISIYQEQPNDSTVYHTFFGGISHAYYFQTPAQKQVYDTATAQGRNDGFPFISDISTFQWSSDGSYKETFFPKPIVGNRLLGASALFMEHPDLIKKGWAFGNGVVKLDKIPQESKTLIGYIYGGIEAQNPLPLIPNTGTFVSNSLFKVYLTRKPYRVIPASKARESAQNLLKR